MIYTSCCRTHRTLYTCINEAKTQGDHKRVNNSFMFLLSSLLTVIGACIDHVNNYTCQCDDGYTGYDCNVDIDECQSSPCVRGNYVFVKLKVNSHLLRAACSSDKVCCSRYLFICNTKKCLLLLLLLLKLLGNISPNLNPIQMGADF